MTDYSNQTLDHGLSVIDSNNGITADNLIITAPSYVEQSQRNEGIYIGKGSTGYFGGSTLDVSFTTDDATHEFAGVQVNGQTDGDAVAEFASDTTCIVASGPGSSNKWGFGLLVNGAGDNTAAAKFTGGNVYISTTTTDYTAQSATVKANATLDFSNRGDVEIHAYSPYGVTVLDAQGQLTFNNTGNVLLKGEIVPGTHTAQTNVVGIQGGSQGGGAHWAVTSAVKEFRIELTGAGVDNDGTSYSTGTKAIALHQGTFDVDSERFVIRMDIAKDVADDSPEGHTSEKAYGVYAKGNTQIKIGAGTQTSIVVNEGIGTALGMHADSGATIEAAGNLEIEIAGSKGAIALEMKDENSAVALKGAENRIKGDVIATGKAALHLSNGHTVIDGTVTADDQSAVVIEGASLELAQGATMNVAGTLTSTNGSIVLNDAAQGTVSLARLSDDASLQVVAASALNDRLGGNLAEFGKAVSITDGAEGTTLLMQEGLVAGETSGRLTADGTLDEETVIVKTNSLMQAGLEMAANMPLMMNRILTNDVRKRMGNLRSDEGTFGAWARYDGGRLSGGNSLESDFQTIQIGFDGKPTSGSVRFGGALSYTSGDTDYARGTADMDGYSLAGYATWFADNGAFVDVVGRVASFDSDLAVSSLSGSMENIVLGVSTEAGWRLNVNNMLYVEPQVEVAYTHIDSDSFNLGSATYDIDSTDSLMGRLGFAAGLNYPDNKGSIYLRASVVHEFLGDTKIQGFTAGSTGVYETDGSDTWLEFGLGANFNLTKAAYVWADIERTAGAVIDEDWRATVGVRYSW